MSNLPVPVNSGFQQLVESCSKEDLAREVLALRNMNVAALGDGEVFVRRSAKGQIKSMLTRMHLSRAKGHWFQQGKIAPTITALGYNFLNTRKGFQIVTPPDLVGVNGERRPNPNVTWEDTGTMMRSVSVRKIGVGRNDLGNLQACDQTLHFDVHSYFVRSLIGKIRGQKDAGEIVSAESLKGRTLEPTQIAVPYALGIVLIVDVANDEVRNAITEDMDIRKFAERRASTICTRNVLKQLFGIQTVQPMKENADLCQVKFVCWMTDDEDFKRESDMAGRISAGEQPEEVEVVQQRTTIEDDEESAAVLGHEVETDVVDVETVAEKPTEERSQQEEYSW